MRYIKTILLMVIDLFLVNMGFLLAINVTSSENFTEIATIYTNDFIMVSLIFAISFYIFRLYNSLWDLTGTDEFILGVSGGVIAGIISIGYTRFLGSTIPINVCVVGTVISICLVIGLRILYRIYRRALLYIPYKNSPDQKRVMIVGAGSAGTMIINEMLSRRDLKYNPVVLVDDDRYKRNKRISGIKVEGNRYDIPQLAKEKDIDIILIAIPTLDAKNKNDIIDICTKAHCRVQIIPGMFEIISGNATVSRIKDVELEDLLGRDQVKLDNDGISSYLNGKNILVTGGGGSIGSELCRQISSFDPNLLIIFDIYENSAYDIQNELKAKYSQLNIKTLIGSIRDEKRLEEIFKTYEIDVVFHAAAHKHVPLMEDSPKEAVKNNVFGTFNLAKQADKNNVKKFVMISTDKAVNPTNIMGATKRLCEMIIQAMNKESNTDFVAVRFGNVLGSNGSVVPLFKRQIAEGGPVTVTHKNITRYFMLIPEAAQLVLQAGAFAKGGEIFVLDMGSPVKIYDLACDLIRLSGFQPNKDIKIKFTGLRPGEKLYEELLMSEEGLSSTAHNKIYIGKPTFESFERLEIKLKMLENLLKENDNNKIKNMMGDIVPTYHRVINDEVALDNE
ncbi:nucleoside-diphosphate sugar epimerase/dehydratase [Clostridium sartagoforme]|uniref:polysaccharide biosynthesis protein n=1 Tax=Clostridium sartagoforme TaxID=84031 RepID=UPI0031CF5F66